jgi:hypothetical protein
MSDPIVASTQASHIRERLWLKCHAVAAIHARGCVDAITMSFTEKSEATMTHAFDVPNEIADCHYLRDIVIADFHSGEVILDHYHQLKAIEPVGSEIVSEVSFIRDTFQVDGKILRNESANFVGDGASLRNGWSCFGCQGNGGHRSSPTSFDDP